MLWWVWVIIGLIVVGLELFNGMFLLTGFGSAAILVGIIDYYKPLILEWQIILWTVFATIYVLFWVIFIKKTKGAKIGQSDSEIGRIGIVIKDINPPYKGKVEFEEPVYGSQVWLASASYHIPKGKRVKVVGIIQQVLKVELAE